MATYYLQKTLVGAGNSFGFSGTNIQIDLDSAVTKVTESLNKLYVVNLQMPQNKNTYSNAPATTYLVDLKQLKWTFEVFGELTNDTGNISGVSPATTSTAVNKMHLLEAMAEQGGQLVFGHRNNTSTETVNVVSMKFEDIETEVGTSEVAMKENEARIHFTILLQKGQDR